ncbi:hypothetical protein [Streptomyces sp. SID5910]|uniref:hypothetical protein n=1 Tax=Streptomyces sp. SID5910 TaxID=2690312 RepID=UPI00136BA706|nr:hypothetical protein [Streptomyces sp. SID5910]MYR46771.1 hypothetical protein [Streptomyces sp. SID5910]
MTPAQRTARACRIAATIPAASAAYSATHHPLLALPGLLAAGIFLTVAASYTHEDHRQQARHTQLEDAADADAVLLPPPNPREQLDTGCCERWWTSCGWQHDETCPMRDHRSVV